MKERIVQIDFLRCICIILMLLLHIVFVEKTYPYFKTVISTFIMPIFLLISGYLANVDRPIEKMALQIRRFLIPYAVMEAGYIVMASLLPIREHIDVLTAEVFSDRLLLHPLGPYWYLHTLILCYVTYYLINLFRGRLNNIVSFVAVLGIAFWIESAVLGIIAMEYVLYFMAGVMIRQFNIGFMSVFRPSFIALLPLIILCYFPDGLHRFTLKGVIVTYLVVCFLLAVYSCLPERIGRLSVFIGRNTLPVLLFSPMFTILTKPAAAWFVFDPTGILYLLLSIAFIISGSLVVAWLMDVTKVSPLFYGRKFL